MNVPWNAATGAAIGADWVLREIAPAGTFGRAAHARERAFRCGDEAAARKALAHAGRIASGVPEASIAALRSVFASAPDIRETLQRARAGTTLDDVDFFELGRFLDAQAAVASATRDDAFAAAAVAEPDAALAAALAPGRSPARTFYLDDAFAPELAARRGAAAHAQAAYDTARSRLAARIARELGRETLGDETFTLMRDALPAALPSNVRILREAATYVVATLELDDATRAARDLRDVAGEAVAAAEEAVRVRLTRAIAAAAPALDSVCAATGQLDTLVARAAFAQRHACVVPEIVDESAIVLDAMRFAPLETALQACDRPYTPLSLDLAAIGIVTGPNMGGKTAALRAVGLAVACVTLGVPVPARSAALPLVDDVVWFGVGAATREDALLSTFASEVVELRAFMERGATRPLVLLDEFARTTSPREGRALAIAVVETLRARGAVGLAVTHLGGIASATHAPHYTLGGTGAAPPPATAPLDLAAALARIALARDYQLVRIEESAQPPAGALALAAALGLDPALLARAYEVL